MDLDTIRSHIPLLHACTYFNTGGVAPSLSVVTDSLVREFTDIACHGPPRIMDPETDRVRLADARRRIAGIMGIEVEDLCLTRGVADGVTLIFNGIGWREGDEMILTDEEHPAVQVPADRLASSHGVTLRRLPVSGDHGAMLDAFRTLFTPRTRLIAMSHVTTDTGTRLPVRDICRFAHEQDIPVFLDGAQALGRFPVDVPQIGADFYSFLNYKWLFGPYSVGGLYIEKTWQNRLGRIATSNWQTALASAPEGARRFEAGPLANPLYYATADAIDYIHGIGVSEIEAYTAHLADHLRTALKSISGVTVESPTSKAATGIVAFSVTGVHGRDVNDRLRACGIIARPALQKFSGVRISVAFFNTEEEVDSVIKAVTEIAGV